MKKYDFETLLDRRGHDAMAIDDIGHRAGVPAAPKPGFDAIPMWVADQNFPTASSITDAIIKRAQHPAFGYFRPNDDYYQAIINWHANHKGMTDLTKDVIGYENGVLGGLISALKVFATPGDSILVHSPTYVGFTHALKANGFNIVHSPLVKDETGTWRMDYEDMDRKIKEHQIHVGIFCNPHNPCGRVWSKAEIEQAVAVYQANDCWIIEDGIWSDLLLNNHQYTAVQGINDWAHEHTVSLYAPSKTFNLAGLIGSYHVIYNKPIRERVQSISSKLIYNSMNVFSEHALIGAYSAEGENWLSQLLPVLEANVELADDYVTNKFDGVATFKPEGTYMMLLDCTEWLKVHDMTIDQLLKLGWDYGIGWQDGRQFNMPTGIRLNLASPTSQIKKAFDRMDKYVFNAK